MRRCLTQLSGEASPITFRHVQKKSLFASPNQPSRPRRYDFLAMDTCDIISSEVTDSMKCPICFEVKAKNVLFCMSSHSVCHDCAEALLARSGSSAPCPECRDPCIKRSGKPWMPDRTANYNFSNGHFKCKNSSRGCEATFIGGVAAMEHHEVCMYEEVVCTRYGKALNCPWRGPRKDRDAHEACYEQHQCLLLPAFAMVIENQVRLERRQEINVSESKERDDWLKRNVDRMYELAYQSESRVQTACTSLQGQLGDALSQIKDMADKSLKCNENMQERLAAQVKKPRTGDSERTVRRDRQKAKDAEARAGLAETRQATLTLALESADDEIQFLRDRNEELEADVNHALGIC